jgi:ribosome biogenesis GTPase A
LPGGRVNMQKAAEIALNDFRSGAWGRITLETPEEFLQWWAQGQALDAQRLTPREKREQRRGRPSRGAAEVDEAAGHTPANASPTGTECPADRPDQTDRHAPQAD